MKKKLLIASCVIALCNASSVNAQSFVPEADTVSIVANTSGMTRLDDTIAVPAPVTVSWRVFSTDFPSDWLAELALGICDATLCRQNVAGQLWNGTSGTAFDCDYPGLGNSHDFHLQLNLVGASAGTHYMTVRMSDPITFLTETMTFIINNGTTSVAAVNAGITGLSLVPNPAQVKGQAVFTLVASSNVQCHVYDIAGRNVYSSVAQYMNAGKHTIEIPTAGMAAGLYNIAVTTDKGTVTQQMSVIK